MNSTLAGNPASMAVAGEILSDREENVANYGPSGRVSSNLVEQGSNLLPQEPGGEAMNDKGDNIIKYMTENEHEPAAME